MKRLWTIALLGVGAGLAAGGGASAGGSRVSPSVPWALSPGTAAAVAAPAAEPSAAAAVSGPAPAGASPRAVPGGASPGPAAAAAAGTGSDLLAVPAAAGEAPILTSCVGPATAKLGVIYLHGLDPPAPSAQEQGNRAALARLADTLGLRMALARSPDTCPVYPGKRCWPNESRAIAAATLAKLLADTAPCFRPAPGDRDGVGARAPSALIGFSNGGYFVGKLLQYCLAPQLTQLVAVGSAGSWRPEDPRADLGACGRLTLLIGRDDLSHNDAVAYVQRLAERGARAALREYDGAHELPVAEVKAALEALLAPAAPGR